MRVMCRRSLDGPYPIAGSKVPSWQIAGAAHVKDSRCVEPDGAGAVGKPIRQRPQERPAGLVMDEMMGHQPGRLVRIVPPQASGRQMGGHQFPRRRRADEATRSEEHTSELQSLMRISYAVFC